MARTNPFLGLPATIERPDRRDKLLESIFQPVGFQGQRLRQTRDLLCGLTSFGPTGLADKGAIAMKWIRKSIKRLFALPRGSGRSTVVRPDNRDLLRHVSGPGWRLRSSEPPQEGQAEEPSYVLKRGAEIIGYMWYDEEASDFPWHVCRFEPRDGYAGVRSAFEEHQACLAREDYSAAEDAARAIEALALTLVIAGPSGRAVPARNLQIAGSWAWYC
ncbi:hypothetical protein [Rhodoplanes sp. SY1]|uniref:hypothetical protein n=1 Tax=Rhodoplanes sp. SY1 TaxID=3166646 RepID=UPI0038B451EA